MRQFESGLKGEALAEAYLIQRGMTTIARRYRAQDGEIDLIMQDADAVVFVEVKARPSARAGMGLMAVTPSKQRRMSHAAFAYLAEHAWLDRAARFDVVEITRDGVLHIPNAFMAVE